MLVIDRERYLQINDFKKNTDKHIYHKNSGSGSVWMKKLSKNKDCLFFADKIYKDSSKKLILTKTLDNGGIIHSQEISNINTAYISNREGNIMTQTQLKEYIKKTEEITKQLTSSKAEARKFLVKNGFCTKDGKLRKYYRP